MIEEARLCLGDSTLLKRFLGLMTRTEGVGCGSWNLVLAAGKDSDETHRCGCAWAADALSPDGVFPAVRSEGREIGRTWGVL